MKNFHSNDLRLSFDRQENLIVVNQLLELKLRTGFGADKFLCSENEVFYQDHEIDLETKAQKFISGWFETNVDKIIWELADQIILPNCSTLSKERVKEKLQDAFKRYSKFSECSFVVAEIKREISDDADMACVEGSVSYNALVGN